MRSNTWRSSGDISPFSWPRKCTIINDLFFNESKFLHIHFGKEFGSHNFTINGTPIVRSNCVKDLGVHVSSSLKSTTHCEAIVSNAYKILGLIRRTFSTYSIAAKKLLYLTLVWSRLTYCSQLWRPHLLKDICVVERVQRRATKYILNDYSSSYKTRLVQLDLLPLMYQYELSDLLFFIKSYKAPHSHFDIKNYVSMQNSLSTRSSSSGKLVHKLSTTNSNCHFYSCWLPRLWNSLPSIDLNLPYLTIKQQLTQFLWNHFSNNFNSNNTCSFNFCCPCSNCINTTHPTPFYSSSNLQ